ncbi:hypothetical protein MgSA37_00065 [Mucilaginibacter gotjawali]|uniref:AraC-type arabinose-binding/dimerisation domain-containing protein n=1 Tax=Mucilaginibacter gotjawali TaxID=1550579 RepID=A0A110B288_9SPHI|nr:hypothetical protein [Mucilaginibacter gotjawali]BAU51916.1 hypothetical protein MgSA37_00065 [Mucilaginibacter gotjawali]
MINQSDLTLINHQTGEFALKLTSFEDNNPFKDIQCQDCFTFIWIKDGLGKVNADFNEYDFEAGSLFNFSRNQPYKLTAEVPVKGIAIYFHFDFFTYIGISGSCSSTRCLITIYTPLHLPGLIIKNPAF